MKVWYDKNKKISFYSYLIVLLVSILADIYFMIAGFNNGTIVAINNAMLIVSIIGMIVSFNTDNQSEKW